jgi:cell wall assembly regulator SMI1
METEFDQAMARIHYRYVRPPDPVTEDDIRSLERELGYPLPHDYRAFLMKYGLAAGRGDTRFTNADYPAEAESSVDVFYGLKAGDTYDLREVRRTFSDRLPAHLLPIASGSGGEFCLSLAGEDTGKVSWWFQETGRVQSPDDLELIADSFAGFVNSLICVEE